MWAQVNDLVLSAMDLLVGWTLRLPTDVALFVVAVGSAVILTLVRLFTTDQDLLRRCAADRGRLRELIGMTRRRSDLDRKARRREIKRLATTRNMVGMKRLRQEGLPLLVSLLPIACLAAWCFARLGYHPIEAGEQFRLNAYFPVSASGSLVHVVPQEGVTSADGWIRRIEPVTDAPEPHGLASWTLRADAAPEPHLLTIRWGDESYEHEVLVGQRTYAPPVQAHEDGRILCSEVQMAPVKLFGVVPGLPAAAFPPWLVAYLLIVVPFVFVLKAALGIH